MFFIWLTMPQKTWRNLIPRSFLAPVALLPLVVVAEGDAQAVAVLRLEPLRLEVVHACQREEGLVRAGHGQEGHPSVAALGRLLEGEIDLLGCWKIQNRAALKPAAFSSVLTYVNYDKWVLIYLWNIAYLQAMYRRSCVTVSLLFISREK